MQTIQKPIDWTKLVEEYTNGDVKLIRHNVLILRGPISLMALGSEDTSCEIQTRWWAKRIGEGRHTWVYYPHPLQLKFSRRVTRLISADLTERFVTENGDEITLFHKDHGSSLDTLRIAKLPREFQIVGELEEVEA